MTTAARDDRNLVFARVPEREGDVLSVSFREDYELGVALCVESPTLERVCVALVLGSDDVAFESGTENVEVRHAAEL